MTTTLRVVLDQVVAPTDPDLAMASRELARALIATTPGGCAVSAVVPSSGPDAAGVLEASVPGLSDATVLRLPRREVAAAWQVGVASGVGGGLIHAPSLFAPLVRHDRVHDHDQTVVTLWDFRAWEHPTELSRTSVAWQRAMLKRAAKHADAIVVPTHAAAERVAGLASFGERVRVISGAPPENLRMPGDEIGRRRALDLPDGFILLSGSSAPSAGLAGAFAGVAAHGSDFDVVVLDVPEGDEAAVVEIASAAGVPSHRVHVRGVLEDLDRGAVFGGAVLFVAASVATSFPWRLVEALRLGVPVVAADSPSHREVIVDGGILVAPGAVSDLADAIGAVIGSAADVERYGVLAGDRGRAFSWTGAAERVWQLHADL